MANIKDKIAQIRQAIFGKEVRESIASGIEAINKEVENTTARQDNVEVQFQAVLDETTDKDVISAPEIIAARVGADNTTHSNLKARLDTEHQQVIERNPINAPIPLSIRTYDGFNRTTHPDVIYFENGWNGYKYWMVHTPFPFDNDFWENPSIVVSNDGVSWQDPPGIVNPIDEVTEQENQSGIHLSDACLVFANNRLECFYRWFNKNTREERLYRQYSYDGVTWEGKEVVFDNTGDSSGLGMILSPTIVFENNKYRMWVVDNPNRRIMYTESSNGKDWDTFVEVPLQFEGRIPEPWHIHVYKESNNLYHLTFSEYTSSGGRSIFWGTSTDGKSFTGIKEILKTRLNEATWDNGYLYRPTLIKVGNLYKLYYSARSAGGRGNWRIGLLEGETMDTLRPAFNYDADFYNQIPRIRSEYLRTDGARVDGRIWIETSSEGEPKIKFLKRGRAGASLTVGEQNYIRVLQDDEEGLGNLEADVIEVRKIIIGDIEIFVSGDGIHITTPNGYRDVFARSVKAAQLLPLSDSAGITARGTVHVLKNGDINPSIHIVRSGEFGAIIETTGVDTIEILRDNGSEGGHLKVGSIIVGSGNRSRNVEGAIRFNKDKKKHEAYDGTTWHELY